MAEIKHPEWCTGTEHGHMHETPRAESAGRNGATMNVQLCDYGSGPFISASAFTHDPISGGCLMVRDRETATDLAAFLGAIAAAGAPAIRRIAAQVAAQADTAYGPEAEAG